ncbi:HAMP domain-containing histidine kinase [Mucilaginibacter achroorhodeus]|uniref:histidine kinase n=1 Tax=Mucilaginibacter achroorhodeus TaxID=2599294 RepID=A0A563TZ05_9SPHI|nr:MULTISPECIES: HAMP domain-containing sensor histidine kinase [Mucilaginibacter]QXV65304.1 HAMP domain-containing histidine kinase [Mucilaginibacter sp. 21P]TWR24587.1 HAMP domain-containing histidine kinase [Mucilaginibacter achroorhodeus]
MKLQTKITLLFVAISTVGLLLLNASIFYFVSEFNFEDFFKRLEARVNLAAETNIDPDKDSYAYKHVRQQYLEKLANETESITKIDSAAKPGFKRLEGLPNEFYSTVLSGKKARYISHNNFYAGRMFEKESGKYIVIVSASDPYGFKELAQLKRVLIFVFLIFIVLAYVAGKAFSYFTVQPVRNIIKGVKNITANNLHMRLDEVKGKDEITELVHTFNNMLTRLETAFETQNNFVSNASHELRTPLTIISGETQLLLSGNKVNEQGRQSVQTIMEEAEKLTGILEGLLGLAQTGFDGKKQHWQRIRIDELVLQVAESVKKTNPGSIIDLDFANLPEDEDMLYTHGNINLLRLALSNIVSNACKYSNNSPVGVQLSSYTGRIVISVTDRGIGIPQEEQAYVFVPFFRASNTSDFHGYGIGLPLTQNIIRLHNGTIGIRSKEQEGTEIQVTLPVA